MQNAGDDAFFTILLDWLVKEFNVEAVEVFGDHNYFPEVKTKTRINGVPKEGKGGIRIRITELVMMVGNRLTVYGAGSLFQRRDFLWLFLCLVLAKCWGWVTLRPKKIVAIGVSLGPFHSSWDRFWCSLAFQLFDLVVLRDRSDERLAFGLGKSQLLHGNDLALTLQSPSLSKNERPDDNSTAKHIGFAIVDRDRRHGRPDVDDKKRQEIVKFFQQKNSAGEIKSVTGFVFCNHPKNGDVEATTQLVNELVGKGITAKIYPYCDSTDEYLKAISELDLMVGNRMHSFIFALISGTPAISIAYEPKITEFAQNCELPDELVVPLKELSSERLHQASEYALSAEANLHVQSAISTNRERQINVLKKATQLLRR